MRIIINYVVPDGELFRTLIRYDAPGTDRWLHTLIEENPDVMFFFTTETTDVWDLMEFEEEEEGEEIFFVSGSGAIHRTGLPDHLLFRQEVFEDYIYFFARPSEVKTG